MAQKKSQECKTASLEKQFPEQLIPEVAQRSTDAAPNEELKRLEQELTALQADRETLQEGFGPASLQLEIIKAHVGTALLNLAQT